MENSLSRRARIRRAFEGMPSEVPPVTLRMDLWHNHAKCAGSLPEEIRSSSLEQIEDMLRFCRSTRFKANPRIEFPEGWVSEESYGGITTTTYRLPGATLQKVCRLSEEEKRSGMRGQIVRYPVSAECECRALISALENASIASDIDGFDQFDRDAGEAGLPLLILGSCPAHFVMLELMGYENFYYGIADYPDVLDALIETLEQKYRAEIWGPVMVSSAELVMHGNHFSSATTPPPIFRRHFLPYFAEFIAKAHGAGKYVVWHADAEMNSLLHDVMDAGFDGSDCLATEPLVRQTIEGYYAEWQGRIVCWGGIPSVLFNPEYPEDVFIDHLRHLREFTSGKCGFIVAVSDNVMPGGLWERILAVREVFR